MAVNASTCDIMFDEDRGGPRDANNLISFPEGGMVHKSTIDAWAWQQCGSHDEGRVCTPSIYGENLFRMATVSEPATLACHRVLTKCLGVKEFLGDGFECLIQEGMFQTLKDDGTYEIYTYEDNDEVSRHADAIVMRSSENPCLQVGANSFEWLEGYDPQTSVSAEIAWFHGITLQMVTDKVNNLSIYIELSWLLGPHSTELIRTQPGGVCYTMIGGGDGGQLFQAMKAHFYPSSQAAVPMAPSFLIPRVAEFFVATQWPAPYLRAFNDWIDYAFDLPRRATWHVASRAEWCIIAQGKLAHAMQVHLPTMLSVFEDYINDPIKLVRETEALGDLLLAGEGSNKQPFPKIELLERRLSKDFDGLIKGERDGGSETSDIVAKIRDRINISQATDKAPSNGDEKFDGPKPTQMARGLAEESYTRLEVKHVPTLENASVTLEQDLTMLADCFKAKTVLPNAVLLAGKGARLSPYTGSNGSDFLAMLHDKRHQLSAYVGQSLAYDADLGQVPSEFRTYAFDEQDTEHLRNSEWWRMDPLNKCLLVIRGREAGTTFKAHDVKNLYHDGDMINHIMDLYGKLFEAIGYPRDVAKGEGLSFRSFMARIKSLQVFTVGLAPAEQHAAYTALDGFVLQGYRAAGNNHRRIVYGASPADKYLHAWLPPDEAVVIELEEALDAVKETTTFRRRTGSIFGKPPEAASLIGHSISGTKGTTSKANSSGSTSAGSNNAQPQSGKTPKGKKRDMRGQPKGKSAQGNASSSQPSTPAAGNNAVTQKRIIPYADGSFSIGTHQDRTHPAPAWSPRHHTTRPPTWDLGLLRRGQRSPGSALCQTGDEQWDCPNASEAALTGCVTSRRTPTVQTEPP